MGSAIPLIGFGLFNTATQIRSNSYGVHAQEEENDRNRAWQTEQAEIARNYNTSERVASQDWAKQMLDYQNQYNSPKMQAQRLQEAGLNPQVSMSGNVQNVSASSQPSTPASSPVPSPVGGLSPTVQPPNLQIPQLMNGIGSMIKNLADAKKAGVETDVLSRSAQWLIQSNMLDAQQKELANGVLAVDKEIRESTKDAAVSKAWDEAKKVMYEALISSDESARQGLVADIMKSQKALNDALVNYHGKNAELLGLEIGAFNRKLNAYIKLSGAQAEEASSHAEFNTQSAEQERIFNKIYNDRRYQHSIISQAVTAGQQAISQKKLTDSQVKHLNYMIEQAAYANDMKEFTYWSGQIQSYLGSVGEAASAFYGAGALRELVKMRQLSRMPATSVKGFK